jgi:hypothetical protein
MKVSSFAGNLHRLSCRFPHGDHFLVSNDKIVLWPQNPVGFRKSSGFPEQAAKGIEEGGGGDKLSDLLWNFL